jgi:hypothetical protein
MKKIRIIVKKGATGKKIPIFNSPESLYVWTNDPELKAQSDLDPSLGMTVHLREGEVMEVEWRGFESIYEKNALILCANFVRLGKDIRTSFKVSKPIVGVHEGWVSDEIFSFKSKSDKETRTTLLNQNSKHKFDLEELFEEHYDDIEDLSDVVVEKSNKKPPVIN